MAATVVQGAAERRLAGRGAEQQGLGDGGVTPQVEQGRADDVLAEIAGGYSHGILAKGAGGAGRLAALFVVLIKAPPEAGLAAHPQV